MKLASTKTKKLITVIIVVFLLSTMVVITVLVKGPVDKPPASTAEEISEPADEIPGEPILPLEEIISEEFATEEAPAEKATTA